MKRSSPGIAILIISFLLVSLASQAQTRRIEAADQLFNEQKYSIALEKYKKLYSKIKRDKSEKARVAFNIAVCYQMMNDYRRAAPAFKRAIRMKYNRKHPEVILYYADALKRKGDYEDAIEQYKRYIEKKPDDVRGTNGLTSCELAMEWTDEDSKYEVEELKKVNSREDDFAPAFADKLFNSVVFTSNREGATGKETDDWTGKNFSDLFIARVDRKGEWSAAVLLDKNERINTLANEGAAMFNDDFSLLFFTRCGSEDGGMKGCQIYQTSRKGKTYTAPKLVKLSNDTTTTFGHPSLSADGLTLVFSSDREDGYGGKDIYITTRSSSSDDFRPPKNIGPVINTMGDEMFPFLRSDSLLYFASDRHIGMGGLDIFKSARINGEWSEPENMKPPINTFYDDFGICFHPEEEKGFFSSNRKGGRGDDDIYFFIEPPVEFTLKGVVKDDRTLQFVEGAEIKMIGSDGSSVIAKTDPKGFYSFSKSQLKQNTTYELIVSKTDYFNTQGKITTVGLLKSKDFEQDFIIQPIPEEPILLPEILYDLAKWDLKPQYKDSLQGLIQTLDQNPTLIIELAAHTDARDTEERNDILSQKRAESVVNYLIERGIDADRLLAKGYGERVPRELKKDINRDGFEFDEGNILTEEYIESLQSTEEKEAAHQLNRRTEFKVISRDFIPKTTVEELAKETDIDIIVDPEENTVPFIQDKGEAISAKCIMNGYTKEFSYIERIRGLNMSLDEALNFLKNGAISKDDFEGDINEILANGTIADKAVFILDDFRVGNITINDVAVNVRHELEVGVLFGEDILKSFGKFTIDYDKKLIIFE